MIAGKICIFGGKTAQAMHLYTQNAKPLISAGLEMGGFVFVEAPSPSPGEQKKLMLFLCREDEGFDKFKELPPSGPAASNSPPDCCI